MGCVTSSAMVPPPHLCYLAAHPQYPARAKVNSPFWDEEDGLYEPTEFTHQAVLNNDRDKVPNGWADPAQWSSELESEIARRICLSRPDGKVPFHAHRPRNPLGRTGMTGRGLLGKYGPNAAADALFLRTNPATGKLQIALIQRHDNGLWAMPGGMLEPGETSFMAAKREFKEETLGSGLEDADLEAKLNACLDQYKDGRCVYAGYVDDPRNTDIAWMETSCFLFYVEDEDFSQRLVFRGGDDAADAQWVDFSDSEERFKTMLPAHRKIIDFAMKTNYFQDMKKW